MKNLFLLFILFASIFSNIKTVGQPLNNTTLDTCFYPLAVGNKWQYIQVQAVDSWYTPTTSSSISYSLVDYSVTEKKIINGEEYFKMNGTWMRYDKVNKVIYSYGSSQQVYFDFNLPAGSIINGNTVVQRQLSAFGSTSICKGFSVPVSGPSNGSESTYFMNNIGMVSYGYSAGGSWSYTTKDYALISIYLSDSTQGVSFVDTSKPQISFQSVEIDVSNRVNLVAKINHKYSKEPYSPNFYYYQGGLCYIGTTYLDYFYYNGTDTVWANRVSMLQQTETTFKATFDYNFELIWQGYEIYYKITSSDKAIIPNSSIYPINGYKKLQITSNNVSNYYPLISTNKWVYNIEEYNLLTGSHQFVKRLYVNKLKDTLLIDNNLYCKIAYNNTIQYERFSPVLGNIIQYTNTGQYNTLDVLGAQLNKTYIISRFGEPDTFKCTSVTPKVVLGVQNVMTKRMVNTSDYRVEYSLSNNLGMIYKYYYEYENGEKKYYKANLVAANIDGVNYGDSTLFVGIEKTETAINPDNFTLAQNYPNPFNPSTTIEFNIPQIGDVKLTVYDILGKEINTLINKNLNAGNYSVNFDGTGLSSGIYFYTLNYNGTQTITKKMVLTK